MKKLIRSVSIVMGNVTLIGIAALAASYTMYLGANNIEKSFVSSGLLVSTFPIVLYFLSRFYQSGVTLRLKDIAKGMRKGTDQIKDMVTDVVESSRHVPTAILSVAIFSSLVLVPNIIGSQLGMSSSNAEIVLGSLMISAEIVLASFMLKDLVEKVRALS